MDDVGKGLEIAVSIPSAQAELPTWSCPELYLAGV